MVSDQIIQWLLQGDVAIQYQVYRDLFHQERKDVQERITTEGWGAQLLDKRRSDGHWGQKFYQPKWTSTHYSLLDLRNLEPSTDIPQVQETLHMIAKDEKGKDGGINPAGSVRNSDVCINGMFLNYATYFQLPEDHFTSVVDFILSQKLSDGGFNCQLNRSGARHSSLHSTISVLEGIAEYVKNGYTYRLPDLQDAATTAREFILQHQLFRSDHTGKIIHPSFLRLPYPSRWKYDILRALDYFQASQSAWDTRMQPAIEKLLEKRNHDGTWKLQAKHPGQVHFEMEKAGKPSRWNTLRVLRVLKFYQSEVKGLLSKASVG